MGIVFNPENHSYFCDGVELTSVTTLIKKITPAFDRDKIAKRCADRDGLSVDEVIRKWEEKGEASRQKGTRIHSYIESILDGSFDPVLFSLNEALPEMLAFDKAYSSLKEKLNAKVISRETIVGSKTLGIAGRVDVIMSITMGSKTTRSIIDWKTGSFETVGRWERLLNPFADLWNCELTRYSLQLSAYRLLSEIQDTEPYGDSYIVHLGCDGNYQVHRAIDYRERILKWLTKDRMVCSGNFSGIH